MKPEPEKYYYVQCSDDDYKPQTEVHVSKCIKNLSDNYSLMWCTENKCLYHEPHELVLCEAPEPKEEETEELTFSEGCLVGSVILCVILFACGLVSAISFVFDLIFKHI